MPDQPVLKTLGKGNDVDCTPIVIPIDRENQV